MGLDLINILQLLQDLQNNVLPNQAFWPYPATDFTYIYKHLYLILGFVNVRSSY